MPNLTEKFIARMTPREGRKQYDEYDSRETGLGLCYSNGGARAWFIFWRDSGGRNHRDSIGRHDKGMSANAARSLARIKLREIERDIKAGVPMERQAFTLGNLIDRYLAHAPKHLAASTLSQHIGIIGRCFDDGLRAQKLNTFTREQIENLLHETANSRGELAANNWYRLTRRMFNLGHNWHMFTGDTPCTRIELFKENERTPHLSDDEAARLNAALLSDPDWRWRAYFPLLLYSGLRKNELLKLTWDRVDFNLRTVTIEKTKNGKVLAQPMVEAAIGILAELPSRGVSEYVFPGNRSGRPVVAPDDAWERIRARAGIPDLHIHDLRHSFASFLINANVPILVVSKALNHSSLKMTQRYAHLETETLRAAMEQAAPLMLGRNVGA